VTAVPTDVFREGGVSYLRIPAPDPRASASFYESVFGWNIREHGQQPSFEDRTGHVIGHFVPDLDVVGQAGVIPYVYVRSVDATVELAAAAGGGLVTAPYAEGDLWVAILSDPAGNALGIWQRGPRSAKANG